MAQDRKYNTKNTNYVPGRVEKNRATAKKVLQAIGGAIPRAGVPLPPRQDRDVGDIVRGLDEGFIQRRMEGKALFGKRRRARKLEEEILK